MLKHSGAPLFRPRYQLHGAIDAEAGALRSLFDDLTTRYGARGRRVFVDNPAAVKRFLDGGDRLVKLAAVALVEIGLRILRRRRFSRRRVIFFFRTNIKIKREI